MNVMMKRMKMIEWNGWEVFVFDGCFMFLVEGHIPDELYRLAKMG